MLWQLCARQICARQVAGPTHRFGERMETLINKLLANPEFRNLFITRAADLLNTHLGPASVQAAVDELAGRIDGDIGVEQERWDISGDWAETVAHIDYGCIHRITWFNIKHQTRRVGYAPD